MNARSGALSALLAAALALTLAACGEKDAAADVPPESAAEQPVTDNEWETPHADDVLLHEEPFTLCEGRTATLELYGYQNGEYDCGVSAVRLLWNDGAEETLLISAISDDVWCTDGYTSCRTADGGLVTGDYNFDGYQDIGLQIDTPAYNRPYYYWFYDAQADRFRPYGSWTCPLVIDADQQTCLCEWHEGATDYYTDTYRPDGRGGLYLAQRDTERYTENGVEHFTEQFTAG